MFYGKTEPGNIGPWLADNQSREVNKEFWLVVYLYPPVPGYCYICKRARPWIHSHRLFGRIREDWGGERIREPVNAGDFRREDVRDREREATDFWETERAGYTRPGDNRIVRQIHLPPPMLLSSEIFLSPAPLSLYPSTSSLTTPKLSAAFAGRHV